MTKEQLDQLIRIYNTFLSISTRGEETIVMGQCLSALKEVLVELQSSLNEEIK